MTSISPQENGFGWIDELTDEQCMEVFWLYVDPPEPFLQRYPPALLGQALRYALRAVAGRAPGGAGR
ncbi:MAG: hypothetical protein ACREMO_05420 [Gemmatimonadales bacterium]